METDELDPKTESVHTGGTSLAKKFGARRVKIAAVIVLAGAIVALGYYYKGLIVAATVNGSPISRLAIIKALEKESGKKALDSLVTEKLIADAAKKKGITVSNDEIDSEIKRVEDGVAAQGGTLDAALESQGMTRDDFRKQITIRKEAEKMLGDKTAVSDADVDKYIADNKIKIPAGQEVALKQQVKAQIGAEKFNQEVGAWITMLRAQASVRYFVEY